MKRFIPHVSGDVDVHREEARQDNPSQDSSPVIRKNQPEEGVGDPDISHPAKKRNDLKEREKVVPRKKDPPDLQKAGGEEVEEGRVEHGPSLGWQRDSLILENIEDVRQMVTNVKPGTRADFDHLLANADRPEDRQESDPGRDSSPDFLKRVRR
jgi:hypothetical protein